jgi:hypothetical protein
LAFENNEVAEAAEVDEAREVSKAKKSLPRTSEFSRFLNSIISVLKSLDLDVLKKEMFRQ